MASPTIIPYEAINVYLTGKDISTYKYNDDLFKTFTFNFKCVDANSRSDAVVPLVFVETQSMVENFVAMQPYGSMIVDYRLTFGNYDGDGPLKIVIMGKLRIGGTEYAYSGEVGDLYELLNNPPAVGSIIFVLRLVSEGGGDEGGEAS